MKKFIKVFVLVSLFSVAFINPLFSLTLQEVQNWLKDGIFVAEDSSCTIEFLSNDNYRLISGGVQLDGGAYSVGGGGLLHLSSQQGVSGLGMLYQIVSITSEKLILFASRDSIQAHFYGQKIFIKRGLVSGRSTNSDILIQSAAKGDIEAVKRELSKRVDLNAKDSSGNTALMYASDKNFINVVKLLIQNGARTNEINYSGNTALSLASFNENGLEVVKILVQSGANVNIKILPLNRTPLMFACLKGITEIAKFLIKSGANINAVDTDKVNGLMMALYKGHINTAKMLIEAGIKIFHNNINGRDALHYARYYGYSEIVDILSKKALEQDNIINTIKIDRQQSIGKVFTLALKYLNVTIRDNKPCISLMSNKGDSFFLFFENDMKEKILSLEYGQFYSFKFKLLNFSIISMLGKLISID